MADKKTFKVGDLVRRINLPFREFSVGEQRIVAEVIPGPLVDSLKFNGISGSYMAEHFELVEPCPPTDEELAAKVREGYKAYKAYEESLTELKARGYTIGPKTIGGTELTIKKTIIKEI